MKSILTLICAATLAGASFAAQSAPAGDQQRIVAELLQMAQQRHAAGDQEMARALTEQASRMMGGRDAGAFVTVPGAPLPAADFASEPAIEGFEIYELNDGSYTLALEGFELAERLNGQQLAELEALGYVGTPAMPPQDDLHATLRQIRQELQALRAEVSALRAELAGQRSGDPFRGGMPTPTAPQSGFFHVPAPNGQPDVFYFQGGVPVAPNGGSPAPSGTWEWRQSGPGQHPGAPPQPAPPGGGSGAWQRHQAEGAAQAQAFGSAHEAHAAAAAAQEAHAAAMEGFHEAARALHGALGGGAAAPAAVGAHAGPSVVSPAAPVPPATPATPRSSAGAGSRPHNLF